MSATHFDAMRESEAAEWIERVRAEGHTRASGRKRLDEILDDIEIKRGASAAVDLRARIERQLKEGRNA